MTGFGEALRTMFSCTCTTSLSGLTSPCIMCTKVIFTTLITLYWTALVSMKQALDAKNSITILMLGFLDLATFEREVVGVSTWSWGSLEGVGGGGATTV